MRQAFAHEAVVIMDGDGDIRAPGAAITVALCGQWDHQPPCPLAPHHTDAERSGDEVRLRVLFAAEPETAQEVRVRIETALARSRIDLPDGPPTRWRFHAAHPSAIRADEAAHAAKLIQH